MKLWIIFPAAQENAVRAIYNARGIRSRGQNEDFGVAISEGAGGSGRKFVSSSKTLVADRIAFNLSGIPGLETRTDGLPPDWVYKVR